MKISEITRPNGLPPKISKADAEKAEWKKGLTQVATWMGPNSATWDFDMEKYANKMEDLGSSWEDIWDQTGNLRGPDGKWRQEISDHDAKFIPGATGTTLGDHLDHPELFKAYPQLAKKTIEMDWDNSSEPATTGQVDGLGKIYIGKYNTAGLRSDKSKLRTAGHEWQHSIQRDLEDFSGGGSSNSQRVADIAKKTGRSKYDIYKSLGGEMTARSTARRLDLTPDERNIITPNLGTDTDIVTIPGSTVPYSFRKNNDTSYVKTTRSDATKTSRFLDPHVTFKNPYKDLTIPGIMVPKPPPNKTPKRTDGLKPGDVVWPPKPSPDFHRPLTGTGGKPIDFKK